jgi:thiaminase (transcriptional activator TenA)
VSDTFFETLTGLTHHIHHKTLQHPTVLAIGGGTLPEETFRYYIEQDYQFLTRYVKVMAYGIVASNDLSVTTRMSELLNSTLAVEMDALRDLYEQFGGEPADLPSIPRSPSCAAYTDHLLSVAAEHDLLVTLSAILPCQWGYREIGRNLKAMGLPEDQRYAAWIEEYADEGYGALVDWAIEQLNALALSSGERSRCRAKEVFQLSAEYEHRFWTMAWNREGWG